MNQCIKKFLAITWRERMLFLEALFFQVFVGMLLKIIPFKRIPRLFAGPKPSEVSSQLLPLIIVQIKSAILRADRISPWRNKCLVQSLAAKWMLSRRGITSQLSLGVAKGKGGKTIAHAWISAGAFEVVEKSGSYQKLFMF